jgi:hypothetical protein
MLPSHEHKRRKPVNTYPRIETAEDLERIVAKQTAAIDALDKLARLMDARIQLLTDLVDGHHEIFVRQGICKPMPKGGPVN